MSSKNSTDVYGAQGRLSALYFDPAVLHMVDDPNHPLYDERIYLPLDEAMVLNIMDQGVIEPIEIWKDPETGKVCVVNGRQRVRHTIEANKRLAAKGEPELKIPAIPRKGSAVRMAQAMVSANEIRRPDTPSAKAVKMAALMERGHDSKDLALLFGCSEQTVRDTLKLLDLTREVREALEANLITNQHAKALGKMDPENQKELVDKLVNVDPALSPRERSKLQREILFGPSKPKPKPEPEEVEVKPKIRSREEILDKLAYTDGEYADALEWVLYFDEDGK